MSSDYLVKPAGQRLLVTLLFVVSTLAVCAQTDSVTISGQIKHLTPRLYRESPAVLITSINSLQAGQEIAHPAPLQPDGTFRVTVPLIYPQEEMYFNAVRVSTAFLASAGRLTINLDADSLFAAAIPFRFGGVNAQINQQFATYKAYEAVNKPTVDGAVLSRRIMGLDDQKAFAYLSETFSKPVVDFAATRPVFPLVLRWVTSIAQYDAASFIYDRATETEQQIKPSLTDLLRPAGDHLLTSSFATAMNRFSIYASKRIAITPERGIAVKRLTDLLSRYSANLSTSDQSRLTTILLKGGATGSDMRFLNTLLDKDGGNIRRLLLFDVSMQQARTEFDSASVDYLEASSLVAAMAKVPIADLPLMRRHIRPFIGDPFIVRSLDDAYTREIKDSVAIRDASSRLMATDSSRGSVEVATGVFLTRNQTYTAGELVSTVIRNNPGRVLYVLRWIPGDPESQALVQAAQRLRDTFNSRDFTLLYLNEPDTNPTVWAESIIKQKLKGEHLYLTNSQWSSWDMSPLPAYSAIAYLIGPNGKAQRKNAELPTAYDKLVEQIEKLLSGR